MRVNLIAIVFALLGLIAAALIPMNGPAARERALVQATSESENRLPRDVFWDSRNRLPLVRREALDERGRKAYDAALVNSPEGPQGAAEIRLHGSGLDVRWESPLGRRLTELAILTSAREHDQPYEWSLHEMEALAVGTDPGVIDVVRQRKPLTEVSDREAIVIQLGRDIFGTHKLSAETYARAVVLLGQTNLVDVVDLMAQYAGTASRLTAVNQQMPPDWKQFLPLPFEPPADIRPDTRSRLPLMRSQSASPSPNASPAPAPNQTPSAPASQTPSSNGSASAGVSQTPTPAPQTAAPPPPRLYSRTLAPEGTGPGQIARHGAGLKSLEASVGRRLMALAILVTAREHDEQYDWTMNEPAALKDGLEAGIIDVVRYRKPTAGLAERDSTLIQFGRELYGKHVVSAQTYAIGLRVFGERDLIDLVGLMAQHAGDAALLTAFDQQLPSNRKPLLPIP